MCEVVKFSRIFFWRSSCALVLSGLFLVEFQARWRLVGEGFSCVDLRSAWACR